VTPPNHGRGGRLVRLNYLDAGGRVVIFHIILEKSKEIGVRFAFPLSFLTKVARHTDVQFNAWVARDSEAAARRSFLDRSFMKQKQLGRRAWSVIGLVSVLAMTTQAAPTVTKMAAGGSHTIFVESDGSLWGMGDETYGALGQGFGLNQTNIPIQILSSNVTAVACGSSHSLFIESDGSLWAMGENDAGELGDGTSVNHYFPERIVSSDVNGVAAGFTHSLFRTSAGHPVVTVSFSGMGNDFFGQLGDGASTNYYSPEVIQSTSFLINEVTAFSGGAVHSLFLEFNGSLWGMGLNAYGQLGNGGTMDQHSAVQIRSNNVVAVAAGGDHSLFIDSNGGLWVMGDNSSGQLGDNTTTDQHLPEQVGANVTAIAGGGDFSLFIKTDGSLWGMGDNTTGQLGLGMFTANKYLPAQIVASNVVAVSAENAHSLFLKSDGSLWGMGLNVSGQLGDGTYSNQFFPVRIVPPPPTPVLTGFSVSGNNVTFNASNGLLGATYYAITSTNMTLPPDQWTIVSINQLSGDGNFTIIATNAINHATSQQFFRIQLLY